MSQILALLEIVCYDLYVDLLCIDAPFYAVVSRAGYPLFRPNHLSHNL